MRSGPHGAGVNAEKRVIYDSATITESCIRFLILATEGNNTAEFI